MTFRFTLDNPNVELTNKLFSHAGAARFAYNHHIGRVKANLGQRDAERSYGLPKDELTPALSWAKFSFINEFNAWKTGRTVDAPVNEDGTRGVAWRSEVSTDVFECASVDAAQALANFKDSKSGKRAGKPVGFPGFKAKHRAAPAFRLRNRAKDDATQGIRVAGPHQLLVPKLGTVNVFQSTRTVRRMLERGRLHLYQAAFKFEHGRWHVALTGVAAVLHREVRANHRRHQTPAGVDVGISKSATVADSDGQLLAVFEAVNALQHAQHRLRLANQALTRTKPGSASRVKAKKRVNKTHGRVANLRAHATHQISAWVVRNLAAVSIEDLDVAGMVAPDGAGPRQRSDFQRRKADANMGELLRQIVYKARWYGVQVTLVDRFYPSSKTCSTCGRIKTNLSVSDRVFRCVCGLTIDRDLNAAINLARYAPAPESAGSS